MKKLAFAFCITFSIFLISMTYRSLTVDDALLKISKEYQTYSLYNSKDHWTLTLCEPYYGSGERSDTLHISRADKKKSPHGDKLYKLYVKDLDAYTNKLEKQPKGQVLIKEVWNVRTVIDMDSINKSLVPVMRSMNDGQYYTTTTRKELYIMYKDKPSKENDEGWWYGIVNIEQGADKANIIESMKINRCVKCHAENKYDRIFGMGD